MVKLNLHHDTPEGPNSASLYLPGLLPFPLSIISVLQPIVLREDRL